MRRIHHATFALFFLLAGCAPAFQTDLFASPDFASKESITYAILPFANRNDPTEKDKYSEAGEVLSDAFETAFLETGSRVVERGQLKTVLGELQLSMTGLTEEEGLEVGALLNADAIVMGTVTAYYRGAFAGKYTTVGFSVKAVDVETGAILWKGSCTRTEKWDYDIDPASVATEVAKRLVGELLKKLGRSSA